jgi:hypothetical protein
MSALSPATPRGSASTADLDLGGVQELLGVFLHVQRDASTTAERVALKVQRHYTRGREEYESCTKRRPTATDEEST